MAVDARSNGRIREATSCDTVKYSAVRRYAFRFPSGRGSMPKSSSTTFPVFVPRTQSCRLSWQLTT